MRRHTSHQISSALNINVNLIGANQQFLEAVISVIRVHWKFDRTMQTLILLNSIKICGVIYYLINTLEYQSFRKCVLFGPKSLSQEKMHCVY